MSKKGLIAEIYKPKSGACSNGGLSSKFDTVTLINVNGPFKENSDRPGVLIVPGNLPNTLKAIPAIEDANKVWWMFGGTFVYSSDSRFPSDSPIALHDRQE